MKDGGQAFPTPPVTVKDFTYDVGGHEVTHDRVDGMTLRDYFAAKALPQVIASYLTANGNGCAADHALRNVPALAYKYADAMLEARER